MTQPAIEPRPPKQLGNILPTMPMGWYTIKLNAQLFSSNYYHLIIKKKKKTCHVVNFAVPMDHRVNIKEEKKEDKYLDLARELRKLKHEDDGDTNCNWRI